MSDITAREPDGGALSGPKTDRDYLMKDYSGLLLSENL